MYYELGTMVCIRKDASPFVNHEKGIGYPRFDVIGEIVCIHPTILSYAVRLSKKFTLTFYQDDIYELPDCISSRRDIFHKLISFDKVNQPFYYPEEFKSFVNEDRYCEHDINDLEATFKNIQQNSLYGMHPEYFPNYRYDPKYLERTLDISRYCNVDVGSVRNAFDSTFKALGEFNKREFERIAASPIRFEIDDMIKANYSKEEIKKMINSTFGVPKFEYKKIIFSGPCTIILWKDGTKTMARTNEEETFDPEKGVAVCFMKRALGEIEGKKVLRKASKQYEDYLTENEIYPTFDEFIEYLGSLKSKTKSVDQSTIEEVKKVEDEQDD